MCAERKRLRHLRRQVEAPFGDDGFVDAAGQLADEV